MVPPIYAGGSPNLLFYPPLPTYLVSKKAKKKCGVGHLKIPFSPYLCKPKKSVPQYGGYIMCTPRLFIYVRQHLTAS